MSRGASLSEASARSRALAAALEPVVVGAIDAAWAIADADAVVAARTRGAIAQLERILGREPDGIGRVIELLARAVAPLTITGRPMFAGLSALPMPTDPIGRMWRLGDLLREYRGDAHIAAAAAAGFDGCDLQVLTERCAGMPPRSYAAGRGWDPAQLAAAEQRLQASGLLDDGQPTTAGMAEREALEAETDHLCAAMIEALGDDVVELVGRLQAWGASIRAADGYYPSSPQEAILTPGVQDWMTDHTLVPFAGAPT